MAGFRESFISKTTGLASLLPTSSLLRWSGQSLILPFYHAIADQPIQHIRHLYTHKNSNQFRKDLDQLLKYFKAIDFHEFQRLIQHGKQPKHPSFLLSFDDGLSEFHDVIAPILVEKGVPAVCFLNSEFIDNRDLFFRYKASLLVDQFVQQTELQKVKEVEDWTRTHGEQNSLNNIILNIKYHDKEALDDLARGIDLDFSEYLKNKKPYLSTPQIEKLIGQGFYFGAHSADHPEYRFLSLTDQLQQTQNSMDHVAEKFDLNYRLFSFPFTDYQVSKSFFEAIEENKICDYTFGGAGQKNEHIPFHFQRVPFEMEHLDARQIVNGELLYYLLKAPFGKNWIQRK